MFGFLRRLAPEKRSSLATPDAWLRGWAAGSPGAETAASLSTVHRAIELIATAVAALPVGVYRRTPAGDREPADDHPLTAVLRRPTPEHTWYEWVCAQERALQLHGNAYAQIVRTDAGDAAALWPLDPARMRVWRSASGHLQYEYSGGGTPARWARAPGQPPEILHVRIHLESGGILGRSPLAICAPDVRLALAQRSSATAFFDNAATPRGVIEGPRGLRGEALERLRASWHAAHAGANQGRVAVLEDGFSFKPVSLSPADAELQEQAAASTLAICRALGVPPALLYELRGSSYNSHEHQSEDVARYTLLPAVRRWEQAFGRDVLADDDAYYVRWRMDGFVRADLSARTAAMKSAREGGWLSANEARRLEDLAPIPGGDRYLEPLNHQAVGDGAPS